MGPATDGSSAGAEAPPEIAEIVSIEADALLAAAQVLARAFRDNPLNVAVVGGGPARRLRSNRAGMRAMLPAVQGASLLLGARRDGALAGVLVAAPPFGYPLPLPTLAARLRCVFVEGFAVARRWAHAFEALDALHPRDPHWYLATLGVDPLWQGRGVGRALLDRFLAEAGGGPEPVYLETDRRANVGFYEDRGFRVVREGAVLDVPIWCMTRPAANAPEG
jgi:ribosomal protein S18 acetylase RimI-like enzyme